MNPQPKPREDYDIRVIPTADTVPLRISVLRPGRPLEAAQFPGDEEPTTRHFGAFDRGALVGIATLLRAPLPEQPGPTALQLRGMATAPEVRGHGHGRELVHRCIAFTREQKVELLWCNARVVALGFYRKLGFEIIGGEFEVPDVGPHFRMWLRI
jgi:GNAT superfamily N-acetyltransferase